MRLFEIFTTDYDMFGWITPEGKLLTATRDHAKSDRTYTHPQVLNALTGLPDRYSAGFKAGMIRWYVEDARMYLETPLALTAESAKAMLKGIAAIESLCKNPKKFNYFNGDDAKAGKVIYPVYLVVEIGASPVPYKMIDGEISVVKRKLRHYASILAAGGSIDGEN